MLGSLGTSGGLASDTPLKDESLSLVSTPLRLELMRSWTATYSTSFPGLNRKSWLHTTSLRSSEVRGPPEMPLISQALNNITTLATTTLSALYFDVIKDTLYCDPEDSPQRLAILNVLRQTLTSFVRMMAPIVPHLAEELHEARTGKTSSVFEHAWLRPVSFSAE